MHRRKGIYCRTMICRQIGRSTTTTQSRGVVASVGLEGLRVEKYCIKKGNTTYYGVIEIDGKLALVCHMDGRDFYKNVYNCAKCGNVLEVEQKRNKRDRAYWG